MNIVILRPFCLQELAINQDPVGKETDRQTDGTNEQTKKCTPRNDIM